MKAPPTSLLLLAVLLTGCAEDLPDALRLRTDADSYLPGARVTVTLVNDTSAPLAYNLCSLQLEQRVEGGWSAEGLPERTVSCPTVDEQLPAGERAQAGYVLDPSLPAGDFHLLTTVEHALREQLASNVFRVGPG